MTWNEDEVPPPPLFKEKFTLFVKPAISEVLGALEWGSNKRAGMTAIKWYYTRKSDEKPVCDPKMWAITGFSLTGCDCNWLSQYPVLVVLVVPPTFAIFCFVFFHYCSKQLH